MKGGHLGVHLCAGAWCEKVDKYLKGVIACGVIHVCFQPHFQPAVLIVFCISMIQNETDYMQLKLNPRTVVASIVTMFVKAFSLMYHRFVILMSTRFIERLIISAIILVVAFW